MPQKLRSFVWKIKTCTDYNFNQPQWIISKNWHVFILQNNYHILQLDAQLKVAHCTTRLFMTRRHISLPIDLGEYTYHHSSVVKVLCLWPQITTSNPPGAFVLIIELHFWKSKLFIQNSLVFAFLTYLFLMHYAIFIIKRLSVDLRNY